MATLQTIDLLHDTTGSMAWSERGQLAVTTSQGVYILSLTPVAANGLVALNLSPTYFANTSASEDATTSARFDLDLEESDLENLEDLSALPYVLSEQFSDANHVLKVKWTSSRTPSSRGFLFTRTKSLRLLMREADTGHVSQDITDDLLKMHRQNRWKDVGEGKKVSTRVQRLRNRAKAVAVSKFATISDVLVTANKSSSIHVWSWGDDQNWYLKSPLRGVAVGNDVSDLCLCQLSDTVYLLLVGTADGLMSAYRISKDENFNIQNLGQVVWTDPDLLGPRLTRIVQNNFVDKRTIRIVFVKSTYLVLCDIDLSDPKLESVRVERQQCVQVGSGDQEIVGLESQGGSECVVSFDLGPMYLLTIPAKLGEEPCDFSMLKTDFDNKNYVCRDFAAARNRGVLLACLQTGIVGQNMNNARLVFLSRHNIQSITDLVLEDNSSLSLANLQYAPDILETFRVRLLQTDFESFISNIKQRFEEQCLSKIDEDGKAAVLYWLASLLAATSTDDPTWSKMVDELSSRILTAHAKRVLSRKDLNLAKSEKDSLKNYIGSPSSYWNGWKCRTCGGQRDREHEFDDMIQCENGHKWPRCCLTLQAVDSPLAKQCQWCGSLALHKTNLNDLPCTLCSGPLQFHE